MSNTSTVSPSKDEPLSPLEESFDGSLDVNNVSNSNLSFEESSISEPPPLPHVSSPHFKSSQPNLEESTDSTASTVSSSSIIRSSRRRVMKNSSIVLNSDRLRRVMQHVEADPLAHSNALPLPPTIVEGDYSVIAGSEQEEIKENKEEVETEEAQSSSSSSAITSPQPSTSYQSSTTTSSSPTSNEEFRSLSSLILFLMNNDKFISLVRGYRTRLFLTKHSRILKLKSDMNDVLNVIKDIFINNQKLHDVVSNHLNTSSSLSKYFNIDNFYYWIPYVNKYYITYSNMIPHLDKQLINSSIRQILNYREELIKIFYNLAGFVHTFSYYSVTNPQINSEESSSSSSSSSSSIPSSSVSVTSSMRASSLNLKKNVASSISTSSSSSSSASSSISVSAALLNPTIPSRSYEGAQLFLRIISAEKLIAAKRGTNVEPDRKPCVKICIYLPSSATLGENVTGSSINVNTSSVLKRVYTHTIEMDKITLNPTYNVLLPIKLPYPKTLLESLAEHEGISLRNITSFPSINSQQYQNILLGLIQFWQRGFIYLEVYDKERFNETLFMGCVTLSLNLIFQPYLLSGKEINFDSPLVLKNTIHNLDTQTLLSITSSSGSSTTTSTSTASNNMVTSSGNGTVGGICGNCNNTRSPRVSGLLNTQCLWYGPEKKYIEDQLGLIYNQVNLYAMQEEKEKREEKEREEKEKLIASLASLKANKMSRPRPSGPSAIPSSTSSQDLLENNSSENIKSNLKLISKKLHSKHSESHPSTTSKNESPIKSTPLSMNPSSSSTPGSHITPITPRSRKVMLNNLYKQLDDLQIKAGEVCDSLSQKLEEKKIQREREKAKQFKEEYNYQAKPSSVSAPVSSSINATSSQSKPSIQENYGQKFSPDQHQNTDMSYSPYHNQDDWDSMLIDEENENDRMNQTFLSDEVDFNDQINFDTSDIEDDNDIDNENYTDNIKNEKRTYYKNENNIPRSSFDLHEDYFNNSKEEIKEDFYHNSHSQQSVSHNQLNKKDHDVEENEEDEDLIVIPRAIPHTHGARNPDTHYPVHLRKKN